MKLLQMIFSYICVCLVNHAVSEDCKAVCTATFDGIYYEKTKRCFKRYHRDKAGVDNGINKCPKHASTVEGWRGRLAIIPTRELFDFLLRNKHSKIQYGTWVALKRISSGCNGNNIKCWMWYDGDKKVENLTYSTVKLIKGNHYAAVRYNAFEEDHEDRKKPYLCEFICGVCQWSTWNAWSTCIGTNNSVGMKERMREQVGGNKKCVGESKELQTCNHPNFTNATHFEGRINNFASLYQSQMWTPWSPCLQMDNSTAIRIRTRGKSEYETCDFQNFKNATRFENSDDRLRSTTPHFSNIRNVDECFCWNRNGFYSNETNSCFLRFESKKSYEESHQACKDGSSAGWTGRLAILRTSQVFASVKENVGNFDVDEEETWVALKTTVPGRNVELDWFWHNGIHPQFAHTYGMIILDSNRAYCARYKAKQKTFDDMRCHMEYARLCEFVFERSYSPVCGKQGITTY